MIRTPTATATLRVLILDRDDAFRAGLALLLDEQPDLEVVGVAGTGEELARLLRATAPHVVVMEPRVPQGGTLAIRSVRHLRPTAQVLVVTRADSDPDVLGALRAGARGYLLKDSAPEAVAAAIRIVAEGDVVWAPSVANRVFRMASREMYSPTEFDGLTVQEVELVQLVASGVTYKQIATQLKLSQRTVRTYISHVYRKLAVGNRQLVVRYALRKGLVEP